MKISEVLFKAIEVLDKRGWCRGDLEVDGRVCALGAINVVVDGVPDTECNVGCSCVGCRAQTAVESLVGVPLDKYNDNVARDKRYIQRKFRRAARISKERGQ